VTAMVSSSCHSLCETFRDQVCDIFGADAAGHPPDWLAARKGEPPTVDAEPPK
jgi:hypothetical protein